MAFSTFNCVVEVIKKIGSTLSPPSRITTVPIPPTLLVSPGSVQAVSNKHAVLDLKPPRNMNGVLQRVLLMLISSNMVKEIELFNYVYLHEVEISGAGLISMLANTTIDKLKANTDYEIRSVFCNQAGCISSGNSLNLKTLDNDQIEMFEAVVEAPTRAQLFWKFTFGNAQSKISVK